LNDLASADDTINAEKEQRHYDDAFSGFVRP
jgi:hypothetical protein